MRTYSIDVPSCRHFFIADKRSAWLWLPLRIYLGYEWLNAGLEKVVNPAWIGDQSGAAMTGFVKGALAKTAGTHPDVQWWYASFLENWVAPYPVFWAHLITWGEVLVGAALILGFLTAFSAFFGVFMNLNFMLAGTVSVNPIWALIGILLIASGRVSGYWGLDRFVLPYCKKWRR